MNKTNNIRTRTRGERHRKKDQTIKIPPLTVVGNKLQNNCLIFVKQATTTLQQQQVTK